MRLIAAPLASAIALAALVGCNEYRQTMMTVPDRGGHAATDPSTAPAKNQAGKMTRVPGNGEMWITLGAQDHLSSVAKSYGVTLEWLISRNDLTRQTKPGDNLIVPRR